MTEFNHNGEEVDKRTKINRLITLLIQTGQDLEHSQLQAIKKILVDDVTSVTE